MEEIVKIVWEGKEVDIVIGEITWKDKMDSTKKAMKETYRNRKLVKELDPILQRELMLLASIKAPPFEKTVENLEKVRSKDGDKLWAAFAKLNELESDGEGEH